LSVFHFAIFSRTIGKINKKEKEKNIEKKIGALTVKGQCSSLVMRDLYVGPALGQNRDSWLGE
jgi:hypothetical protein